jgi:DNA mismatch repair protein MutS2
LDDHSLRLIEYFEVTATVAERAESELGRARLTAWRPLPDRAQRQVQSRLLAEAIRRTAEPGDWCAVGPDVLGRTLDRLARDAPEGQGLRAVGDWLEAGRATRAAWGDQQAAGRHPELAARAAALEAPEDLRAALAGALDADGGVRDQASPDLARLRAEHARGEKRLAERLERWAAGFGSDAYVTRHGERFVAMVRAAGFPRRRAIVHDVSGSGESLLVEPLEFCGENNRLIEVGRQAAEEERRVVADLAARTLERRAALEALEEGLVALDTLRARARWAIAFGGVALEPGGERLRLARARHPLLAMGVGGDAADVVPLDLELGDGAAGARALLVSGPNMGGKTVLLKTVGLAVCLAHAALPVTAAAGSRVPELDQVLADIGDEQSLARGLSTFAARLEALSRMARAAGPRVLVLADELGAGTDPEDGAAVARALLEHLAGSGTWVVATTHLGSLKRLAGEVPGIANGSLEFDLETLTPRYRFQAGVPGASHALAVAERLGFPPALLARAASLRPESARALERLMAELAEGVRRARQEAQALAERRAEAERAAARHRQAVEELGRQEAAVRRRLAREGEAVLARAREVWQMAEREARRAEKRRADTAPVGRRMGEVERELRSLAPRETEPPAALPAEAIRPGVRVRVLDLGVEAEVVSPPDPEGRVHLQRGSWGIQSHVGRLAAAQGPKPEPGRLPATWETPEGAPGLEVDLRGMEVSEALKVLDHDVDRAVLAGLGELRVIHGVGRGVLRAAVERHLRDHPQVAGQRPGEVGEGGRGVTVARLR